MRSIDVIIREICAAISEGKSGRTAAAEGADEPSGTTEKRPRRRSQRAQFTAASDTPPPDADPAPGADAGSATRSSDAVSTASGSESGRD